MSISSCMCCSCDGQTGVTRIISQFFRIDLASTLPIKARGGKEYGRRFFQLNKRKPTSMHEVLGATLQTLEFGGPVWKGKDLYLLNPTVSIFLDPEKVLCGKSDLLRHAKFSDLLSFLNQDQLFCSPIFIR